LDGPTIAGCDIYITVNKIRYLKATVHGVLGGRL